MKKSILITTSLFIYILPIYCVTSRRDYAQSRTVKHGHRILDDEQHISIATVPEVSFTQKPTGDPSCPCLSIDELAKYDRQQTKRVNEFLGRNADTTNYGLNCAPHDLHTKMCEDMGICTTLVPVPTDCDNSFCQRSFCFVDPLNCTVLHKPSTVFPELHYSYATCGFMDSFTYSERRKSLQGRTLKVALNSNTGGWMGAYNPGGSFAQNTMWTGPVVEFVMDAARRGGFTLNITTPPAWLKEEAKRFFGDSSFDFCVYATSLGYLDLCVAAYTITDKRSSVTPIFEIGSDPVYLVTFSDDNTGATLVKTLTNSLSTIFQPFTWGSWVMIAFIILPILGLLMLLHEYGTPGSAFPEGKELIKTDPCTGDKNLEHRTIPIQKHIPKALYMSYLSFFNGSYDPVIVTTGGKINLLAILSFVLLVLAVYTANLAAILTQDASKSPIDNLSEAIKHDYNFCASRTVARRIIDLFGVDPDRIVSDPVALGGDGKPGFNCPDCNARERIFDFMDQRRNKDKSLYCDAALASYEDLQVLHRYGSHCNKTAVGDILAFRDFGIPLASSVSDELMSWFYQMKYEGILDQHLFAAMPESQCPDSEGEEGIALNVEQLLGIWTVVFGFAITGLMVKLFSPFMDNRKDRWSEKKLYRYDQWCNPVENPNFRTEEEEMMNKHGNASEEEMSKHLNTYQEEEITFQQEETSKHLNTFQEEEITFQQEATNKHLNALFEEQEPNKHMNAFQEEEEEPTKLMTASEEEEPTSYSFGEVKKRNTGHLLSGFWTAAAERHNDRVYDETREPPSSHRANSPDENARGLSLPR